MAIWRVYKVYCLADSSLLRSRHVLTRRQTRSAWKYCFHSQREPLQPIKDPATPRRAPLVADLQWLQVLLTINGEFQDPKMEVLYHIFGHIFWGYSLTYRPYIGLIYGRYLHFRILKWPLIPWSNHATQASNIFHLKKSTKNHQNRH